MRPQDETTWGAGLLGFGLGAGAVDLGKLNQECASAIPVEIGVGVGAGVSTVIGVMMISRGKLDKDEWWKPITAGIVGAVVGGVGTYVLDTSYAKIVCQPSPRPLAAFADVSASVCASGSVVRANTCPGAGKPAGLSLDFAMTEDSYATLSWRLTPSFARDSGSLFYQLIDLSSGGRVVQADWVQSTYSYPTEVILGEGRTYRLNLFNCYFNQHGVAEPLSGSVTINGLCRHVAAAMPDMVSIPMHQPTDVDWNETVMYGQESAVGIL